MKLTNKAQQLLTFLNSQGNEATAEDIYNALHMDKTVLLSAIYQFMQNGLEVTTTSDSVDIRTVRLLKGGERNS